MRRIQRTTLRVVALAVVLAVPMALAQMGTGQGMGQGMGKNARMPMYDPSNVVTVKGTIDEVQEGTMQSGHMGQMKGMHHMGTHLLLKTDNGNYTILVGPSSFVKDKNFEFSKGDQIEVTGSKMEYNGGESLIARDIKKGDKVLTLRNERGIPEWSMGQRQ